MTFISPINTITLDCSSNILPNAILLADVDATKSNKLLVGTQEGELLIFKAVRNQNDAQLWRRAQGLGFIKAIAVGSLITNVNELRPMICVTNAEGTIHLFLLRQNLQRNRVRSAGGSININSRNDSKLQLHGSTTISNDDEQQQQIQAIYSQQLICNPKVLLIQDFNENEKQLIIGYCDRTIRIFISMIMEEYDGRLSGRIVLKHIFNVAEQIHTLNSKRLSTRDYELIVAQPGGNLLRFNPNDENVRIVATDMCSHMSTGWTEAIALERFCDEPVYAAICHDHIDIFPGQLNKILSTIPLSVTTGYLCGLRKGPVTKDNYNQLVTVSSVDGDTFLIDRHSNIVRFRPPLSSNTIYGSGNDSITNNNCFDQIQAFTSGLFGDNNLFCFIYVLTHNDKILIVHSIEITNTRTANLLTTIAKTTLDDKLKEVGSISEQLKDILHPHY
ncbi:unnamed protein product [Rotaria sordida]|uniref:Uncharacterized protein n=1 Tax=Rotaria sordida TaxID=392033 RepID=A0A819G0M8_9BILA|nr:unnamed protein product [Rotaria sordida]CAF0798939.1 unnamed protein product [Rotaria sordida]CAF0846593.1 unnamed protein product [Rotaria sordida]CAF0892754.1 unnamed protein product [Rotaria sordida]CAF3664181.1 unnamed protein product [Rotaria sordida]